MTKKEYKICSSCKIKKPATNEFFHKDSSRGDGLYCYCKECKKIAQEKNRDRRNKKRRASYIEDKTKILRRNKIYTDKNKDKILARQKQHRLDNINKYKERNKKYRKDNRDRITKRQKILERKERQELKDPYIKKLLARQVQKYLNIPQEIIETKRLLIKLNRSIKLNKTMEKMENVIIKKRIIEPKNVAQLNEILSRTIADIYNQEISNKDANMIIRAADKIVKNNLTQLMLQQSSSEKTIDIPYLQA